MDVSLPVALLLVVLGICSYLTLHEIWLWSGARRADLHWRAALWCGTASLFIAGRLLQRLAEDPDLVTLAARIQVACAVPMGVFGILSLRAMQPVDRPIPRDRQLAWSGAALFLVTLVSPVIIRGDVSSRVDAFGYE